MVPKVEVVQHVYHVVRLVLVLQPQVVEHAHLHQRLVVEPLLVADDLDGHQRAGAVIHRAYDLTEGTLADDLEDLVSVCYVVVNLLQRRTSVSIGSKDSKIHKRLLVGFIW